MQTRTTIHKAVCEDISSPLFVATPCDCSGPWARDSFTRRDNGKQPSDHGKAWNRSNHRYVQPDVETMFRKTCGAFPWLRIESWREYMLCQLAPRPGQVQMLRKKKSVSDSHTCTLVSQNKKVILWLLRFCVLFLGILVYFRRCQVSMHSSCLIQTDGGYTALASSSHRENQTNGGFCSAHVDIEVTKLLLF